MTRLPQASDRHTPRVLVAGMGSELRSDDAFGLFVVRRMIEAGPPEGVEVFEAGTAGIGLVQQLFDGYACLILVDAVERDREPGSLFVLEPEVPEIERFSDGDRSELLSDMHYTVPSRVLTLAKALKILPSRVLIVGCQPGDLDLGMDLSEPVARAVDDAVELVEQIARQLLQGKAYVSGHSA
jgi:hydrogenase maturation protease